MQTSASAEPLASTPRAGQTLLFDADDTLWENNIYFEQAIDRFVALAAHPERPPAQIRDAFHQFEAGRVKVHGYGTDAFHASLVAAFEHLTGTACDEEQERRLAACALHVRGGAMVVLPHVADTLARLAQHHTLLLVTKGDPAEQTAKLQRSGLQQYFSQVEVLREKHTEAYRALVQRYRLSLAHTWMIGNSPRSDVNPALAAGLHAVYLPHPSTWVLEQEAVLLPGRGQTLLQLGSFAELLHHFS